MDLTLVAMEVVKTLVAVFVVFLAVTFGAWWGLMDILRGMRGQ